MEGPLSSKMVKEGKKTNKAASERFIWRKCQDMSQQHLCDMPLNRQQGSGEL